MPLRLTIADRAVCVPVLIHLRKYHSKPHLSCIGCSLTFHFVWQTLIFTSKVLSRRHPTHTYLLCSLSRGCFRRNCRNPHTRTHTKLIEITFDKCVGVLVSQGSSKQLFYSCCVFTGVPCTVRSLAACNPKHKEQR